jgi:asparaginyl-tRNA synthetase
VDITGACESVPTVLRVDPTRGLLLAQTGQLSLERALQGVDRVWCHTVSFRDDRVDQRHLREFELIEEEFVGRPDTEGPTADSLFELLLERVEDTVKTVLAGVTNACAAEVRILGGNPRVLETAAEERFRRVTYDEAIRMLSERRGTPTPAWGMDLTRSDEAFLLAAVAGGSSVPVFVTHFPEAIKFFNMKLVPSDPRVVYSADLILPGAGETVGAAVREDDHAQLRARFERLMLPQLSAAGEAPTDGTFEWYFDAVRERLVEQPAGYGLGLERLIQYLIGGDDIREASLSLATTRT